MGEGESLYTGMLHKYMCVCVFVKMFSGSQYLIQRNLQVLIIINGKGQ